MDVPDDNAGHRARLRKRLVEGGGDALLDHELIEFLLTLGRPRIDTKPIAKELLRRFGTVSGVLTAPPHALSQVPDMGESSIAALKIAQAAALRLVRDQAAAQPVLGGWQALIDYLHADMAHHAIERVRVLHLNTRNMLIADELVSEGTIDQSALYVREVIRRAIELGSAALILVHNHPSGDPSPSRADIDVTREVIAAGKPLNIAVHDHVIIGRHGHASLRALGLI